MRQGQELRFCQRCGRAHALDEFDPGKHSCRAQLEKHNARRRKRQGDRAQATTPAKARAGGRVHTPAGEDQDLTQQGDQIAPRQQNGRMVATDAGSEQLLGAVQPHLVPADPDLGSVSLANNGGARCGVAPPLPVLNYDPPGLAAAGEQVRRNAARSPEPLPSLIA